MCRTWGSNSGPLACQANKLPIELPRPADFLRQGWKVIITISGSLPTSAPWNVLVLVLVVLIPERNLSSPRCSQSGCDVIHMGCTMSTFWMAYSCLGCLPAHGCCRLRSLRACALYHRSPDCRNVHKLLKSSPPFEFQSLSTTRMSCFSV